MGPHLPGDLWGRFLSRDPGPWPRGPELERLERPHALGVHRQDGCRAGHQGGRHQRRPLPQPRGRPYPGPHELHRHQQPDRCDQPKAHDRLRVLPQERGGDARALLVVPRGDREHPRGGCQVHLRARLVAHVPAQVPAARPGRDLRGALPQGVRGRSRAPLRARLAHPHHRRRQRARALRARVRRHLHQGLRRLLPHRAGVRALGQAERHRRRPGPWLGRGRHRRLRHGHHHLRPARERPHVREVPLHRALRDARYRHGLRRRASPRGRAARARALWPRARLPRHHILHHQGQAGHQRR